MVCEVCGKEGTLYNVEMEGTKLVTCEACSTYGKKINKVVQREQQTKKKEPQKVREEKEEPIIIVVDDYNVLIKNKRERLGLKQEELAKSINEKESLIQQIETKKIEPNVKVAEKLEKKLGLKLLETYKAPVLSKENKKTDNLTLGDMIQIKTRKKK